MGTGGGVRVLFVILLCRNSLAFINMNQSDHELHDAARYGDEQDVVQLLGSGANVNYTDAGGSSPLHMAAANGHLAIVKLLLANGANVDSQNESGNTALHWAALNGHSTLLYLIKLMV